MRQELSDMAKQTLRESLAGAYRFFYYGCDDKFNNLPEEEKEEVLQLIDQYGALMCSIIGVEYYKA